MPLPPVSQAHCAEETKNIEDSTAHAPQQSDACAPEARDERVFQPVANAEGGAHTAQDAPKATTVVDVDAGAAGAASAANVTVLMPFKAKGAGKGNIFSMKKRVLADLGDKSIEDAIADARESVKALDDKMSTLKAVEEEKLAHFMSARDGLRNVQEEIQASIEEELKAAEKFHDTKRRRLAASKDTEKMRHTLLASARKLALYEVMATTALKMKELEEKKNEVTRLAEEAAQERKKSVQMALEQINRAPGETDSDAQHASVVPSGASSSRAVSKSGELDTAGAAQVSQNKESMVSIMAEEKGCEGDTAATGLEATPKIARDVCTDGTTNATDEAPTKSIDQQEGDSSTVDASMDIPESGAKQDDNVPGDADGLVGRWLHSNGSIITISREGDSYSIDNPIAGRRELHVSDFVRDDGLHYCHLKGTLHSGTIAWSNGASWSRQV